MFLCVLFVRLLLPHARSCCADTLTNGPMQSRKIKTLLFVFAFEGSKHTSCSNENRLGAVEPRRAASLIRLSLRWRRNIRHHPPAHITIHRGEWKDARMLSQVAHPRYWHHNKQYVEDTAYLSLASHLPSLSLPHDDDDDHIFSPHH